MIARDLLIPHDLWCLVAHQVWARLHADGTATVGITALGIRAAGEICMCRPRGPGSAVEQGRSVAVVELTESIVSVKSPVRGTVVAINERLADAPELVHRSPCDEDWLARVSLADFEADRAACCGARRRPPRWSATHG